MAYGTRTDYGSVIFFDVYTKKDEKPHFRVSKSTNGKTEKLPDAEFVEGYVKSVAVKYEEGYEKRMVHNLYLHLVDSNELYIIRIGFNLIGRSIMNALISLNNFPVVDAKLTIRLYWKKNDKGEMKSSAYVGYGPERLDWVMSWDETMAMTKTVVTNEASGESVTDYSKLNLHFVSLMNDLSGFLKTAAKPPIPSSTPAYRQPAAQPEGKGVDEKEDFYSDPGDLDNNEMPEKFVPTKSHVPEGQNTDAGDDLPF